MMSEQANAGTVRRGALTLAAALALAVIALGLVHALSKRSIERAREAQTRSRLEQVLAGLPTSDNTRFDKLIIATSPYSDRTATTVYRVLDDTGVLASVMALTTPNGYSGAIELLVGVDHDGEIVGVRVGAHQETPGLGDRIEYRRSPWLDQFLAHSLTPPDAVAQPWRLAQRSGEPGFDALSGATITSRAVVDAVHQSLVWFDRHRDTITNLPSDDAHH